MTPLRQLEACGQAIWLDYLKRSLIQDGGLKALIDDDGLKGVTSNPSIFEKAIAGTDEYAEAISAFLAKGDHSVSEIYEHLASPTFRRRRRSCVRSSTGRRGETATSAWNARPIWRMTPRPPSSKPCACIRRSTDPMS